MSTKKNAARVAVLAEPCPNSSHARYFDNVIPNARCRVIEALTVVSYVILNRPGFCGGSNL